MLKPALAIFSMVASCKLPFGRPNLNFLLIDFFGRADLPVSRTRGSASQPILFLQILFRA
jgi:hypothetical protein